MKRLLSILCAICLAWPLYAQELSNFANRDQVVSPEIKEGKLSGGKIALQAIWDCDLQKYVDTIHRLNAIKPDLLLPGHGCVALNRGYLHIEKAEKILETLALPKNCIGE